MSRYLYSNLLKLVSGFVLMLVFIPSIVVFIFSCVFDKYLDTTSLIVSLSCIFIWIILEVVAYILNTIAKNKITFFEEKIRYKGVTLYKQNLSFKYFKFHVSLIEPSLVIPKLHINGCNISVTCYASKRDIRLLKKFNYEIMDI